MNLVEVSEIPTVENIEDVPLDNLMDVYKVCQDMETICTESHGIGISAVQVGIPWKLFLVKSPAGFEYYINCDYEPVEDAQKVIHVEGCLSLQNMEGFRHFLVERYDHVRVRGLQLLDIGGLSTKDVDEVVNFHELGAVFQHEIDHHKGVLISDIGKEVYLRRQE